MANDRKTKSFQAKPERPQDSSAAIRARDTGDRLTQGGAGGTMGGNRDSDARAHGEAGSSGTGMHQVAGNPENGARIHSDEKVEPSGSESGGGSGALGASASTGTMPGANPD